MRLEYFGYKQPIGSLGWYSLFSADRSSTRPEGDLKYLDDLGKYRSASLAFNYPFIRKRFRTLELGFGAIQKKSKNIIRLTGVSTSDHLNILTGKIKYDISDTWGGSNLLILSFYKGLSAFGSSKFSSLGKSRSRRKPNFFRSTFYGMRTQELPNNFQISGILNTQWAPHSLLSSERFKIGGPPNNLTYPNATFAGDKGLELKVELGYLIPEVPGVHYIMPYTYFAHGKVWNKALELGEFKTRILNGYSFGLRSFIKGGFNAFIEYGIPSKKNIQGVNYNAKINVGLSYAVGF